MDAAALRRFESHIRVDVETGCWRWTGPLWPNDYARFYVDGESRLGHRVAYEHFVGPIPEGLDLDHVRGRGCLFRDCVWAGHLEPVTRQENLLRGDTIPARNAAKTECAKGHPYDEKNTGPRKRGSGRACRACAAESMRRQRSRSRAD